MQIKLRCKQLGKYVLSIYPLFVIFTNSIHVLKKHWNKLSKEMESTSTHEYMHMYRYIKMYLNINTKIRQY